MAKKKAPKNDDKAEAQSDQGLSWNERVFLDLHRARRSIGPDFRRNDPKAWFYLERARTSAIVAISLALRDEPDRGDPAETAGTADAT